MHLSSRLGFPKIEADRVNTLSDESIWFPGISSSTGRDVVDPWKPIPFWPDTERPRSFFHGVGEQGRNRKDQARGRNSVELWRRTGGEGKGKKGQPPCPRARRMLITLMVVPLEVSCALSRPFVKQRRRSAEFRILRVDISDSFTVSVKRTLNDKTEAN